MPAGEAYATSEEYTTLTGEVLTDAETDQVDALLVEVADLIQESSPNLDARMVVDGRPAESRVKGISIRAVQRYRANPKQASQLLTGPFSEAYAAVNARGLWLTADDLAALAPAVTVGAPRGVGSIRLGLTVGTVGSVRRGC